MTDMIGYITIIWPIGHVSSSSIIQFLWKIKIDWDEQNCKIYGKNFTFNINVITFTFVSESTSYSSSDASQQASGACIMCKLKDLYGNDSESRIALLKTISILRLELCAAISASKLTKK